MARIGRDEALEAAITDLLALGTRGRGFGIRRSGPDEVEIALPGEPTQRRRVYAYDTVDVGRAHALVRTEGGAACVVANRVTGDAGALLSAKSWSWMDRRGEAHVNGLTGDRTLLFLDTALVSESAPTTFAPAPGGPIRGTAGVALAVSLLLATGKPPSLRSVARSVGMSPQAVSDAARHLRTAGLVDDRAQPVVPDLFWALAAVWRPLRITHVAEIPRWGEGPFTQRPGDDPGWVLAGDAAALALGAPMFVTKPLSVLWAPDLAALRQGARWCGTSGPGAAILALPATSLACTRSSGTDDAFPLPHPLFAALDLAGDPGRGREVLAQWTEPEVAHVWR